MDSRRLPFTAVPRGSTDFGVRLGALLTKNKFKRCIDRVSQPAVSAQVDGPRPGPGKGL